jgi:polar amino acid transport system substrate-binding protein
VNIVGLVLREVPPMKRACLVLLAWTIGSGIAASAAAEEACELLVGWEPYAPYTFADANGEVMGADIDLIKAVGDAISCETAFVELPWARILREVRNGTLDTSTSTSLTEERTEWALFSEPYRETEMAIYVRTGEESRFDLQRLGDIPNQQFRIGVIIEYYYGDEFEELADDPESAAWIDGATDYATNIRKLINGRIDGYLAEDIAVMEAELKSLGLTEKVARYPLRIAGEKLRFMFSRQTVDPKTVADVDAAVARMRADGRWDTIMNKYLP